MRCLIRIASSLLMCFGNHRFMFNVTFMFSQSFYSLGIIEILVNLSYFWFGIRFNLLCATLALFRRV